MSKNTAMSRIRKYYGVPARRGMRITFRGKPCTITGSTRYRLNLYVRFDDMPERTYPIHPVWRVEYPEDPTPAPDPNPYGVRPGQRWRDNDPRSRGRVIRVVRLLENDTHALVEVVRAAYNVNPSLSVGRQTQVLLRRFKPNASGYELMDD